MKKGFVGWWCGGFSRLGRRSPSVGLELELIEDGGGRGWAKLSACYSPRGRSRQRLMMLGEKLAQSSSSRTAAVTFVVRRVASPGRRLEEPGTRSTSQLFPGGGVGSRSTAPKSASAVQCVVWCGCCDGRQSVCLLLQWAQPGISSTVCPEQSQGQRMQWIFQRRLFGGSGSLVTGKTMKT
ncbi:hypothetical protein LIA77_00205 [Sarocladium implicatum]|nr:hypothetical protein LIA77_00205 [Sarocladium implicatum]